MLVSRVAHRLSNEHTRWVAQREVRIRVTQVDAFFRFEASLPTIHLIPVLCPSSFSAHLIQKQYKKRLCTYWGKEKVRNTCRASANGTGRKES